MRVAKAAEKILCHPLPVLFFDMSMISSKKPFMMTLRLMIWTSTKWDITCVFTNLKKMGGILIEMLTWGFSYLFSKQFENILLENESVLRKKIQINVLLMNYFHFIYYFYNLLEFTIFEVFTQFKTVIWPPLMFCTLKKCQYWQFF